MRHYLPALSLCALGLMAPLRALADDAICTDRPTKSTGPCAAPEGHLQVEADLFDETYDREGGVTSTTQVFASPTLKYGVTKNADIELNFTPYERQSVREGGVTSANAGFGDLYFKAKIDLLAGKGAFDIGLAPYIKAPTASHDVGNGAVEGGLIVPMVYNLPDNWSVTVDPEIDALENSAGDGHHANAAGLVSVGKGVGGGVTLSGELWSDVNWDPAGRVTQVSFDIGAAWIPASHSDLQLDGGFNFGLNRQTPDVQGYVGLSKRF
jgi:hypothetical protein